MQNQITVSIIIPVYNEIDGIHLLLERIESYYNNRKFEFEIIFVNDGSTDGTAEAIVSNRRFPYKCRLVNFSRNFGAHAAVRAGFSVATGQYITCLPADLQISFNTVEDLYNEALKDFQIVYAVRGTQESGALEKIFSRLYALIMRKFVNENFPFNGLETLLISKKAKAAFNDNIESNSSVFLQALSMGFRHTFINIEKVNRNIGKSKWTLSNKVKLLIDSFVAFSYAPIRLVSLMGITFFAFGILWTIYVITRKLIYDDIVEGWSALTSILLLGFGITNIGLGVLAEYIWRTLDSSRNRPVFIVDEIVELNKEEL